MSRALIICSLIVLSGCTGGPVHEQFEVPPEGQPITLAPTIDFTPPTAMAFDTANRPYLVNNRRPEAFGRIETLRDGRWLRLDVRPALRTLAPEPKTPTKRIPHALGEIVFDDGNRLYATIGGALIFSPDLGGSFKAHALPTAKASLELRSGPGALLHPPAIAVLEPGGYIEGERWGRRTALSILLPRLSDAGLELGAAIPITDNCAVAGSGGHSGGSSFAVSTGNLLHLVWAAFPDSGETGNPTWVATVDRRGRRVVARRLLGIAPPEAPDVHSRPSITADADGTLHVVSGAHGQPFLYWRSLEAGTIEGGWSEEEAMDDKQTYASLVCDGKGRLHSVFRQWLPTASLGYQRRDSDATLWDQTRTLVHGAPKQSDSNYGIFYQRLWVDRRDAIYLAYTYWETSTRSEGNYPDVLVCSEDGGENWRYVDTDYFTDRVD